MTTSWDDYVKWTHETAVRRAADGSDPREKAELLEIWALGFGGEFLEWLVEHVDEDDEGAFVPKEFSEKGKEEIGDCVYYLARLFTDTGNSRGPGLTEFVNFKRVVRSVKDVVETCKKALRKEGRSGLLRLGVPGDVITSRGTNCVLPALTTQDQFGRREEFGALLDEALACLEQMIEEFGSSLDEVMDMNRKKLERRRAEGTISTLGERYDEMIRPPSVANEIQERGRGA